jgi:hypothetical protein
LANLRHGAALAVWTAAAVPSWVSCSDLVAGEAEDTSAALCAILQDCDAPDLPCSSLDGRFEGAAAETRDDFLTFHAAENCLETCSSARVCRDRPPVCHAVGEACAEDADCCGSTRGTGACVSGSCCKALGAPCSEGEPCCFGESCQSGHCGGYACTDIGGLCSQNVDCCSRLCDGGACSVNTCSRIGEGCKADSDCCVDGGVALVCGAKETCDNPPATCEACVPSIDPELNCCLGQGQLCFVLVDGSSKCLDDPGCVPNGVVCGSSSDCCPGEVCSNGAPPSCCAVQGSPCGDEQFCCPGLACTAGACV